MHLTAFFLLIFKFEKKPKKAAGQEQQVGFVLHLKKKKTEQNKPNQNPAKTQPVAGRLVSVAMAQLRESAEQLPLQRGHIAPLISSEMQRN